MITKKAITGEYASKIMFVVISLKIRVGHGTILQALEVAVVSSAVMGWPPQRR
jgi:hypothetical protein